ncbi:KTSC domain-containing protein [Vitreimonas sp.]|uniref:KTSC domain-containing protein n=1 Tax=Vitreimonas sp. TaxID=3069702 RepID=UPI0032C22539
MPAVNSSAISQVEYDAATSTLSVWFTSGKQYDYPGVPATLYQQLLSAPSVGQFFNAHIRDQYSVA